MPQLPRSIDVPVQTVAPADVRPPRSREDLETAFTRWENGTWLLAAFVHLVGSGGLDDEHLVAVSDEDRAAARVLVAGGLADATGDTFELTAQARAWAAAIPFRVRRQGVLSMLGQIATIIDVSLGQPGRSPSGAGWADHDDDTLLAQGRASAFGGTMLATMAVPALEGLAAVFATGGRFLDVGTGVGELGAAFAAARPAARVVGLDVLPRALDLARRLIDDRHLRGRVELRLQGIEELDDVDAFDLAFLPAPFIPADVFDDGLARIVRALRPGGWVIVAAGRFDGDPVAVEITRWQTLRAGGTPLDRADAQRRLAAAGLCDWTVLPTPANAPALYAARRPTTTALR